jgi:hypothetical protein
VTQELHSCSCKHTLCRVDLQAVFLKDGKKLSELVLVLLQCAAGDDVVVELMNMKGRCLNNLSVKHWKVWAAF